MSSTPKPAPGSEPASALTTPPACENASGEGGRDTFCVLAWNHLQIAPNGTIKMCCIAGEDLHERGRPLSLYTDPYREIWNSDYMREARRGMAQGEEISACARCYQEEDTVGESRRTIQNRVWLGKPGRSREASVREARENGWAIRSNPGFLQLNMGNLCNLACRMCSSQYSSRIERDPVHNKWMPANYPELARWRGSRLHFGPRPFFGVTYDGFHTFEASAETPLRWSAGTGRISLDIAPETRVSCLGVSLRAVGPGSTVVLRLNGQILHAGPIDLFWSRTFNVAGIDCGPTLTLELEAPAVEVAGRPLGVALLDTWLERDVDDEGAAGRERALTRLPDSQEWWADKRLMFGELLGEPETLEYIIFQGGEPFLVKEFESILDELIRCGAASRMTFEIVSNLTILKDSTIEKLAHLKQVLLGASIDGIGRVLEYIRYPAEWRDIEENIARVRRLPNLVLTFNTAVQLLNLHHMPEILGYGDRHGIDVHCHFLVGPRYLNVLVLPPAAREAAIDLLSAYLEGSDIRPVHRHYATYMVTFLTQHRETHYRSDFDSFVRFTNDLDVSRGQDFRQQYPRLTDWFADAGQGWLEETRYARRPAKVG